MKSIGIKLADGSFYPIMEEGSAQSRNLKVTTVNDNQTTVHIDVYRSETGSMEDAEYVDTLEIQNLHPHPNGEPDLDLDIGIDDNNELHAEVKDPETGRSSTTSVNLVSRSLEERSEPANFTIDSTPQLSDNGDEVEELIGTDPNNEDFSFDSIEEENTSEKSSNPQEDNNAVNPEDDLSDFNFDEISDPINLDPADPEDISIPKPEEESAQESIFDLPDLSQASNLVDVINNKDNSDEEENTETEEEEEVLPPLDDIELPKVEDSDKTLELPPMEEANVDLMEAEDVTLEEIPDTLHNDDDFLPYETTQEPEEVTKEVYDEVSPEEEVGDFDSFVDAASSLSQDQDTDDNDLLSMEDVSEEISSFEDVPDETAQEEDLPSANIEDSTDNTDELNLDGLENLNIDDMDNLNLSDMSLPEIEDDTSGSTKEDTKTEIEDFDLPDFGDIASSQDSSETKDNSDDFDINSLDLSDLDTPKSEDDALPNFDLSSALTSVTDHDFEIPDFDSPSASDTVSASDNDSNPFDFNSTPFASDLSSSSPLYSQDLYDKETLEGNSKSDSSSGKRSKAPVIICIICALICIVAAGIVLLPFFPIRDDIKKKFVKDELAVPITSTDPDVEMQKLEDNPAPEENTAEEVPQKIIEEAPPIEFNIEPQDEDTAQITGDDSTEDEVVAELPDMEQNFEFNRIDTSAKEDSIVVVTTPEAVVPATPPASTKKAEDIRYKVKWGDTLWDIAKAYYKNPWRYTRIAGYNNIKDPDHIVAGTVILIPAE